MTRTPGSCFATSSNPLEQPRFLPPTARRPSEDRSEEHTSELQSLAYLVCRLLLEKKKEILNYKFAHLKFYILFISSTFHLTLTLCLSVFLLLFKLLFDSLLFHSLIMQTLFLPIIH